MNPERADPPAQPEEMSAFFDRRVGRYERHMQGHVEAFAAFYASVAAALPDTWISPRILDLGVGTGLELEPLFARYPGACVTAVDLSRGMLDALAAKDRPWSDRVMAVHGSFLEMELGSARYDAVISAMALHHWLPAVKADLYGRIRRALVPGGLFVNADFVAEKGDLARRIAAFERNRYDPRHTRHIDLPLTIEAEMHLLVEAGFERPTIPFARAAGATFVAQKPAMRSET